MQHARKRFDGDLCNKSQIALERGGSVEFFLVCVVFCVVCEFSSASFLFCFVEVLSVCACVCLFCVALCVFLCCFVTSRERDFFCFLEVLSVCV